MVVVGFETGLIVFQTRQDPLRGCQVRKMVVYNIHLGPTHFRPCTNCTKKGYQCLDRVCVMCAQQGIDGECPHRPSTEQDTSEPDGKL